MAYKSIFNEEDDIGLMLNPKPQSIDNSKKSTLMEELFGDKSKTSTPKLESSSLTFNTGETFSNTNLEKTKPEPVNYNYSTREPRRRRLGSTVQNDPLGLFQNSEIKVCN